MVLEIKRKILLIIVHSCSHYISVLTAAGIKTKVDLPAVGTNLQDHALTITLYQLNDNVNETSIDSTNSPAAGAVAFPNLYQVLGQDRAGVVGTQLHSSIADRAKELVASGGFSSQKGAEKMLKYQADAIVTEKGGFYLGRITSTAH